MFRLGARGRLRWVIVLLAQLKQTWADMGRHGVLWNHDPGGDGDGEGMVGDDGEDGDGPSVHVSGFGSLPDDDQQRALILLRPPLVLAQVAAGGGEGQAEGQATLGEWRC